MGHWFTIDCPEIGLSIPVKGRGAQEVIHAALDALRQRTDIVPALGEALVVRIWGESVSGGGEYAVTITNLRGPISAFIGDRSPNWNTFQAAQQAAANQEGQS